MENTEQKQPVEEKPKVRKIIIETNGNDLKIVKAEVGGSIEFVAILQTLIGYINNQKK